MLGLLILAVCFIPMCILYDLIKGRSAREINDVKYQYTLVGTDVPAVYHDTLLKVTGEISKKELKESCSKNAIYAWVQVGSSPTSWKNERINKELFLETANDCDNLPVYLQEKDIVTVGQYRKKYGI